MKLYRVGAIAGLLAGALALAACSSSKANNTTSSSPAGAGGSSSSSGASASCASGTLNSSGSTAQQNAIGKWIQDYQAKCSGTSVNYGGGGSGQGITDFTQGKTDFAGSDSALDPAKGETDKAKATCGSDALDLPMVVGPIAIAYKLNGVTDLTLTPKVLAQIFLGKITKWNDDQIKALNSGANLPSTAITVFFRSDQSGTTNNFEKYLAATDPTDFTATPSKVWPGSVGQGKTGSQGVQQALSATDGGIAYIEWSFAGSAGLPTAKIDNGGGAVALTGASAGAAIAAATITGTGNDLTLKIDYKTTTAGAYPIVLVTYEVVCQKYKDTAKGALVKSFLSYTSSQAAQGELPDLGYAPLPASILSKVQASVASIS